MTGHRWPPMMTAVAVAALLTGCGGSVTPGAERFDLTEMESYGCGYGFWLGTEDEQVAVRLAAVPSVAAEGELPRVATLPDPAWDATMLIGEDLYANWCDDVLEPGEPEPAVDQAWPITAGAVLLEGAIPPAACPTVVRASLRGLQATRPDGTVVELGDRDVVNDTWGCLAG